MMPPGTSCSSQRPTSSIIATTALQDIPGQCVARAISFLGGEPDKLTEWLALRTTKIALWRQGVDEPDVLAATAEVRFLGGEESRHSPHARYVTQLLAQIAWEVDLLEDLAPKAASSKPQLVEDTPSMTVRPSNKTSTQSRRPASAGRPAKNPGGPSNLDREAIVLERWEKKLAFAFHLKAQRNKEVEIKAREQNSKIEAVRKMHAKLLKESEELQYNKWQGRTKDHDDKIARSRCAKREICELMMNAAAARQAVLETNRRRILQEQAERQAKRMEQETERQTNAEKKRQDVRTERCVGNKSRTSSPKARKDWLPRSPEPDRPKPVEAPRAPKSNPAPIPGEGRPAAPLQQPAKAAGDVPDWLQDLFGGSNTGNVAGPLLRPRVPHREVMVPQQCVARLIGKGGEVIMGICNTTGADVKIRQETKELGYSLAIITGHPDAMDAAERLVRQKLGLSGTGFASKELTVQSEHVPTIMGAKGTNLARIRQQAGNLAIELRPPDLPGQPHTAILGPGSQEQLMVAEQLIMATLAEAAVANAITNR